jgi:hypothetical protein
LKVIWEAAEAAFPARARFGPYHEAVGWTAAAGLLRLKEKDEHVFERFPTMKAAL